MSRLATFALLAALTVGMQPSPELAAEQERKRPRLNLHGYRRWLDFGLHVVERFDGTRIHVGGMIVALPSVDPSGRPVVLGGRKFSVDPTGAPWRLVSALEPDRRRALILYVDSFYPIAPPGPDRDRARDPQQGPVGDQAMDVIAGPLEGERDIVPGGESGPDQGARS